MLGAGEAQTGLCVLSKVDRDLGRRVDSIPLATAFPHGIAESRYTSQVAEN